MAAPADKNIKNLNGKWLINKQLSDSPDPTLALQGIGWLTRKAIGLASVTLHITCHTSPPPDSPSSDPVFQVDIVQTVTGGLKGTTERRCFDWQYRPHSDHLFGDVKGRSRVTTLNDISKENEGKGSLEEDVKYLVEGWLQETIEGEVAESYVENEEKGWSTWQIWGFAEIDGKRMYTRRFVTRKGKDVQRMRMSYDWVGPLDNDE